MVAILAKRKTLRIAKPLPKPIFNPPSKHQNHLPLISTSFSTKFLLQTTGLDNLPVTLT
jgi:hypothetical protein